MAPPATYASMRQFAGIAVEATPGTPIAMTNTAIVVKLDWEDKPKWLDDKGWRGSMTELAGRQQGPIINDFTMSGDVFGDVLPFTLANLLGDLTGSGATAAPTTTLSALVAAGVTGITTVASIPAGSVIQIDTGNLAEIRTTGTPTGTGPYTIPFAVGQRPLMYGHASAVAVTNTTGPYVNAFSLLNSGATPVYGQGQPVTNTVTHYQGVTPTVGARQFPGACCESLDLEFNAETELLKFSSKWVSWPSVVAGALPVAAPSAVLPIASWRGAVGIGGPASGGTQLKAVPSGKLTITRKCEPDFTVQGLQTPYIIQRGGLSMMGDFEVIAADETHYNNMINNTQPQFQFLITNGLSGANLIQLQVDAQQASYKTSKMDTSKTNIRYKTNFEGIANSTNAGGTGGISPVKVTVTNAIAGNTYQ